jgi:hypothetical protein
MRQEVITDLFLFVLGHELIVLCRVDEAGTAQVGIVDEVTSTDQFLLVVVFVAKAMDASHLDELGIIVIV